MSAESRPSSTRSRMSALSSPSVSLRNIRSGAWATRTPPLENSKPVGQCRWSAKTVILSALPSPSVSSRIRILSFISSLGFQCG